ncbi:F-box only protein 41-like [Sinocyclocheilus anshuiensis]|uniref:F-box only protein 41-like n=1 Tax=Sinocyclocheilus anshuiensis TaxID=1608454 RepID=UPI0007B7AE3F|nr:PREDICTED: F-box only protein 41-like [Sinocyclocheilus anshuiensis]
MSTSTELPLHCLTCGEACGFGEHLSSVRSCQKLCLTPRRSSEGGLMSLYAQRENEIDRPLRLELLDALSLARPLRKILIQRDSPSSLSPVLAVAMSSRAAEAEADTGHAVAQLGVPWLGRLALEARLQQLALEVQERVSFKLETLQDEVQQRSAEVRRARRESERMHREKRQAEERAAKLERQGGISMEMLASLRYELRERDEQLQRKQQEVCELDRFVQDTALQEASAKIRLQHFIEDLLERAERAETQLQNLYEDVTSPHRHLAGSRASGYQRSYSVSGMSRRSSHVSDYRATQYYRFERRPRTLSAGSGGCEGNWDRRQYQHVLCGAVEGPDSGSESPWMIQHTHTDADSDNWTLYTAESQDDTQHTGYRTYSSTGPDLHWRVNRSSESAVCSERLRLKAALFCVYTYLDTCSLLTAAEVCKDWRSVARHPAVWIRVTLENARVSSKFLMTLSQWCCQTQSLVLHNLKPRSRGKKESKDEYLRSTRGGLEAGLEAVLKSAGRSLVALRVSHCPNILTDRSLWVVSCHCRALQSLTYRSASDPAGKEVIWALGAGCRNITMLRIAPLQPCLQPDRFSNRCLQTIGRCWPNLCRAGVGGASCGAQGLASLVRNCVNLCELELHHMNELNQEAAAEICRDGLQQLHTLRFISTPVTTRAILHFSSVCVSLKYVLVQLSISDYFEDADNEEAKRLFEEIVNNLQALRKRPALSDVLQIRVEKS